MKKFTGRIATLLTVAVLALAISAATAVLAPVTAYAKDEMPEAYGTETRKTLQHCSNIV